MPMVKLLMENRPGRKKIKERASFKVTDEINISKVGGRKKKTVLQPMQSTIVVEGLDCND